MSSAMRCVRTCAHRFCHHSSIIRSVLRAQSCSSHSTFSHVVIQCAGIAISGQKTSGSVRWILRWALVGGAAARAMATLEVGTVVYFNYVGNPNEWHERVILGHVDTNAYMVVTPTFDFFAEDIQLDAHVASFRIAGAGGALPLCIDMNEFFGFDPLSAAQRQGLFHEGRRLTAQEQVRRGVAVGAVG